MKVGFKKTAGLPFRGEIPGVPIMSDLRMFSRVPSAACTASLERATEAFLLFPRTIRLPVLREPEERSREKSSGCADHWIVNAADLVAPAYLAMRFTTVRELTALVLTVALAVVARPGTVTLAGTVAAAVLLLESATTTPAAGAGPLSVTVAVELVPCVTLAGWTAIDTRAGGLTESVAARVTPAYFA